jgi:undecaprenyl-diphosphatase
VNADAAPAPPPAASAPAAASAAPPGRGELGRAIAGFDERIDQALERWRGRPVPDAIFTTASHLGEFSLIWHATGVARGLTSDRRATQAIVLAGLLGAESLLVNQGIKRLFRRKRPTEQGDARLQVRRPLTSSFPSGHASSAAFAATILSGWDGRRSAALWWTLAATVATSRAYVRIHHASDVVAGMAVGALLGQGARRLLRRRGMA